MEAFDSPQVQARATIKQAADYQIINLKKDGVYWFDSNSLSSLEERLERLA
jgi:hypothetical protein